MSETPQEQDGHQDSHLSTYNKIIVTLTVLTALEFGLAQLVVDGVIGFGLGLTTLVGLAAWKAVLVGRVFMHLKYDPKLLSWIVVSPVILGTPLVIIGIYDAVVGPTF